MSERRDRLVALRTKMIKGDPPYVVDPHMLNKKRDWGTAMGLDELRDIGDYAPGAASLRMVMQVIVDMIDDDLERAR